MTSIENLIKQEVNPFSIINLTPGNFWQEQQDSSLSVESIHQEAITEIEEFLDLVAKDHRSRTLFLLGDSGSGKTYLLGRLKRTLNPKAFFAYISSWADSSHIWRHTLRYTVDSLMKTPESQQESQLMLWLKSLSAFTKRSLGQRIAKDNFWELLQSDRQKFIKHLKYTYKKESIYNADIFFGVLHDLTNPDLYDLACEWLRGDELSEESMQSIKVKSCIDEESAKLILANIGKISTESQPIVLCFDNLDNIPRLSDGFQDFQPLFNVNTTIHNDYLKNFLVIISIMTDTWKRNVDRIQQADKARIERLVQLKRINLEQAEALWAYQLKPLHSQANPQPPSHIFPLTKKALEQKFPGGKTIPRFVLMLGREEYQKYKIELVKKSGNTSIIEPPLLPPTPEKIKAEFQLLWQAEYSKVQEKITKITQLSAPELIRMLQEALSALQIQGIKPKLLSGKYASNSLSYQQSHPREQVGVVWTEDENMTSFYTVMDASQKAVQSTLCQKLYLIRAAGVGNSKLKGNQIYRQIFIGSQHHHIKPNLPSVHYLATYHNLVNAALAHELVLEGKTRSLQELETLIFESQILHKCTLLQNLGIVPSQKPGQDKSQHEDELQQAKKFLLNLVITEQFFGKPRLIQVTNSKYSQVSESEIEKLIQELCQENKIKIINPKAKLQDQLICWIPEPS